MIESKKTKKRIIIAVIIAAAFFSLYPLKIAVDYWQYNEAKTRIAAGEYNYALNLLEQVPYDYKTTFDLKQLCRSYLEYEDGDIEEAYSYLDGSFARGIPVELASQFNEYAADVYDEYNAIQEEKRRMQAEWDKEIREELKNSMPYVGMGERYITYTKFGAYSSKSVHDTDPAMREQHTYRIYHWKNSKDFPYLTVICYDGVVTRVEKSGTWNGDTYIGNNRRYSSGGSSSKSTTATDEYNVNSYYDAEDFYDDHFDDFYDYYDAEDYFNEHKVW